MLKKISPIFLTAIALAGCATEPVNTIDSLIQSTSNDGVYSRPINLRYPLQTRFLAVNGKIPVPDAGSACLASSFRPANSMVCFSKGGTTVLKKHYAFNGIEDDLLEVKSALTKLSLSAAALASTETEPTEGVEAIDSQAKKHEVEQAKTEVARNVEELKTTLTHRNLFVFRWMAEDSQNADGKISTFLSAGGARSASESGVVIVGGLTVSQLLVGPADFENYFTGIPDSAKIATLTLSAERLLYFSDNSIAATLAVAAKGTPSELKVLADILGTDGEIAVNAALELAIAAQNQGSFSTPAASYHSPRDGVAPSEQIFFATMTDLRSLRRSIKSKSK